MCDKKKKNKKKKKKKKTKKLSQFLKSHISGTREAILLKFGMWSAAVGGNVHSKNRLVSSRKHRATEVRKLRFLSSCQYTHGCYAPASWAARHTTVCLDNCTALCMLCLVALWVTTVSHWPRVQFPSKVAFLSFHKSFFFFFFVKTFWQPPF